MRRRNAFDQRFRACRFGFGFGGFRDRFFHRAIHHFVTRFGEVDFFRIGAQAFDFVIRRFQVDVRNQQHRHLETRFDFVNILAFFVEQECRDIDRHLRVNGAGAFLHRFFLNNAQDMQRGRCGIADVAEAMTARARDIRRFRQRRLQTLTRKFEQTEARNFSRLHAGAIVMQRIAQTILNFALILGRFHVDEIDHDQAAQIAQPQLARDFVCRFAIGAERGLFDIVALGRARRVDVDRDQCFGVIDDDRATGGQRDIAAVGCLNLMFDLKAREQRHVVVIQLDLAHIGRHHGRHERLRLFENFRRVDQNFADVGLEQIADCANHQARFEINQFRAFDFFGRSFDRFPELDQVIHVPLELFRRTADAGRAGDDTHAIGDIELVEGLAQFGAIFAFDTARNTAAARIVWHQHQIAAGERNVGRQRRAFVAAFVFFDLYQNFLADFQILRDLGAGAVTGVAGHVFACEFLERQEAVALSTVIDEYRFERGLDPRDDGFVNIAFFLFLTGVLDIEIDQFLPINDGDAKFFLLRRIE